MGKAAIPGLGGGVVPPEANITQRTHGLFTCSEVNTILLINHDIDVDGDNGAPWVGIPLQDGGFIFISHILQVLYSQKCQI